jgi:hypothetical protein
VVLLGIPCRIPVVGHVYKMPADYYDPTDRERHPLLVVSLDQVVRQARVATRTSRYERRGPRAVVHAPQPSLRLGFVGWWRLHNLMAVPYLLFGEPDVQHLGPLDSGAWDRVVRELEGGRR